MTTGSKNNRPNLWKQLAEQTVRGNQHGTTREIQLILCSPFAETIEQFLDKYFPKTALATGTTVSSSSSSSTVATNSSNKLCLLSYDWFEVQGITHTEEKYEVDAYSIVSTNAVQTVSMTSPLLKHRITETRLCFILDWSIQIHNSWLAYLLDHIKQFRELGIELKEGDLTIVCTNADQIFELQRATTAWHPFHIDFIQQTLRSVALFNGGSLIYIDSSEKDRDNYSDLLRRIVCKEFDKSQVEMVKSSKIFIPFGTDTVGFIKTVDDSFDPDAVRQDDFVTRQYEKVVPKLNMTVYEPDLSELGLESLDKDDNECKGEMSEDAFQARLAVLYEMSKKATADKIHNRTRISK